MNTPDTTDTLHKRLFDLTVEFDDADRKQCFDTLKWKPEDGSVSDAIISEVTAVLEELGLRATVVLV